MAIVPIIAPHVSPATPPTTAIMGQKSGPPMSLNTIAL
jgi:hypothetical protein